MPPRKTRTVAPRPVQDVPLEGEEPVKVDGRTSAARQARRLQMATAEEKVRLPEEERAVEVTDGQLVAPIKEKYFRLQESLGLMPLMEWAAAQDDLDADNQVQLAGLFRLLKDLVAPEEWAEFRSFTREAKCIDEDFIGFVNAGMEAMAARPTGEPAAS
ncbi:MAG TPA: hypothetical protein VGG75_38355 [Trebonia sp.]